MPELVSTLCTFLVLAPLALMPGMGEFLFRPMAMAVAFAMIAAYILSRSFVPSRCSRWLKPHAAMRKKVGRDGGNHADTHGTADGILVFDDVAFGGFQFAQDATRARKKGLAQVGEAHGTSQAIEQPGAKFILELHDLLR